MLQQLYLCVQLDEQQAEGFIDEALQGLLRLPLGRKKAAAAAAGGSTCDVLSLTKQQTGTATSREAAGAVSLSSAGAGGGGGRLAEKCLLETTFGFNGAFCVFDGSRLLSLEGISHIFSFDLAMPPWVMAHTVRLFNK